MKQKSGQISTFHLIGWGLTLALGVTGAFWAKIGMTDSQVNGIKVEQAQTNQRVATVEEAVRNLTKTTDETRADVKELLKRINNGNSKKFRIYSPRPN